MAGQRFAMAERFQLLVAAGFAQIGAVEAVSADGGHADHRLSVAELSVLSVSPSSSTGDFD